MQITAWPWNLRISCFSWRSVTENNERSAESCSTFFSFHVIHFKVEIFLNIKVFCLQSFCSYLMLKMHTDSETCRWFFRILELDFVLKVRFVLCPELWSQLGGPDTFYQQKSTQILNKWFISIPKWHLTCLNVLVKFAKRFVHKIPRPPPFHPE